jgi:transposase InsO family protein
MITNNIDKKSTKTEIAKSLGVSRQSLYYKPIKPDKDMEAKKLIETVMTKHKSYGHKRIALELQMNKKKVRRIMKKFNLKPYRRRTNKPVKPEDINKAPTIYNNLTENIIANEPNLIWVADFTYIPWQGAFIYLATIMDLFAREIIGWAVGETHDRFLCISALETAFMRTGTVPTYHHSDQGSEYDSEDYLQRLTDNQITISMSRKGHPWENGFQESFYSGFKVDLGRSDQFDSLGELIEAIYLQINYYNTSRIHTSLKTSPVKFKERYQFENLTKRETIINPEPLRQLV